MGALWGQSSFVPKVRLGLWSEGLFLGKRLTGHYTGFGLPTSDVVCVRQHSSQLTDANALSETECSRLHSNHQRQSNRCLLES